VLRDTFDNLLANQWLWPIVAVALVALVWVITSSKFNKTKPSEVKASEVKPSEVIQDQQDGWRPTGRIDFSNPQSTGNFILQAEDTRTVESLNGVEHREIRWRDAALDEAKSVVAAYHAQRNLTMAANFSVNSSFRRPSHLDNEHRSLPPGKDEVPENPKA
jgi:hypothetical protein